MRLEFFGDEIESLRQFEIGSQRSVRDVTSTRITRALFGMRTKTASTPEGSASEDSALASRPEGR